MQKIFKRVGLGFNACLLLCFAATFTQCNGDVTLEKHTIQSLTAADNPDESRDLGFRAWCVQWDLDCVGEVENFPLPTDPWSTQEWQAVIHLLGVFLSSQSQLQMDQGVLFDQDLLQAAKHLELEAFVQDVFKKLQQHHWQAIGTRPGDGKLQINFNNTDALNIDNGLVLQPQQQISLQPSSHSEILIEGLSIGSLRQNDQDQLQKIMINRINVFDWQGAKIKVQDVPMAFVKTILGFDMTLFPQDISFEKILHAAGPLLSWLSKTQASLVLSRPFWQVLEQKVALLVDDPIGQATLKVFSKALTQVESVNEGMGINGNQPAYFKGQLKSKTSVECLLDKNKSTGIVVSDKFGIRQVERLANQSFRLHIYGFKGWTKVGWFKPSFKPRTIDVTPNAIIINDVPFMGDYRMPLGEISEIRCH